MHAKMTRDRKKLFINSVEKTIAELEEKNKRMRSILAKQAVQHAGSTKSVTPEPSPLLTSSDASTSSVPPLTAGILAKTTTSPNEEQENDATKSTTASPKPKPANVGYSVVA